MGELTPGDVYSVGGVGYESGVTIPTLHTGSAAVYCGPTTGKVYNTVTSILPQ